ncbi:hypothetical protein OLZ32_27950 [Rhizobium sp. 1AS11]|uniref:hypothetical protein n=1 Tax=Rhizobium acaciae TaxID=2989736 RepID=UPI00222330AB|nr:hypothetical protein [Rhizobium acaciae]MCW1412187.1 hypothetical protein [Rhizobium acaciae]MCW1744202.1 hypothetical protein [Rhizobium acaciae]
MKANIRTILDIVFGAGVLWLMNVAFGHAELPSTSSLALYLSTLALLRLNEKGGDA